MEDSIRISQSSHWDMAPASKWSGSVADPELSYFWSLSHCITPLQDSLVHTLSILKQGGSWCFHRCILWEHQPTFTWQYPPSLFMGSVSPHLHLGYSSYISRTTCIHDYLRYPWWNDHKNRNP